jgi:hypothetical protein
MTVPSSFSHPAKSSRQSSAGAATVIGLRHDEQSETDELEGSSFTLILSYAPSY